MSFRFRRSARSGGAHTTVGLLPGTGLRWKLQNSTETVRPAPAQVPAGPAEGLPNSLRFRDRNAAGDGGLPDAGPEPRTMPSAVLTVVWKPPRKRPGR